MREIWLDRMVEDSEIRISGFKLFRRDRNRSGGGMLVYVPEHIKAVRREELEVDEVEVLWIEIKIGNMAVLVCNVYRPPDTRAAWMEDLMMEKAAQERTHKIVLGDFNKPTQHNSNTHKLKGVALEEYGLVQMISCPTRVTETSASMIDLLFTSALDLIKNAGCEEVA